MHVPAATSVTVVPDTVHTPVVNDVNVTVRLELAVALTVNAASPYVLFPSAANVIVWPAWATVKLCVTCAAAL